MKISSSPDIHISSDADFKRFQMDFNKNIFTAFNNQINWGDNLKVQIVSVTFAVASTTVAVPHNFGFVPLGFQVLYIDVPDFVYADSGSTWTTSNIYLKCSTSTVVKIAIIGS